MVEEAATEAAQGHRASLPATREGAHGWGETIESAASWDPMAARFEAGVLTARITFRDERTIAGLYFLDPQAS